MYLFHAIFYLFSCYLLPKSQIKQKYFLFIGGKKKKSLFLKAILYPPYFLWGKGKAVSVKEAYNQLLKHIIDCCASTK